jgi:hypothetical protein
LADFGLTSPACFPSSVAATPRAKTSAAVVGGLSPNVAATKTSRIAAPAAVADHHRGQRVSSERRFRTSMATLL